MTLDESKIKQIEVKNNIYDLRVNASINFFSIGALSCGLAGSVAHGNMMLAVLFSGTLGGNIALLANNIFNINTQKQELLKLREEAVKLKQLVEEDNDINKSHDAYSSISFTRENNHLI